ncbi:RNA polymerase subunit sigma-70 [Streptomyces sp. NPDC051322]|uniref:RNA polymerase subunit sigma-70 n=1 Tax=Streptomyces sp. NPDC051322 TaxID=3154645 RepID=UPI00345029EF
MTSTGDFEASVQRHRPELLAHCYRMLGSVHDAEELVQEMYLRAWRARDRYDPSRASLRTWLYRIATNACLTALDGRARRPMPSGLVTESEPLGSLVHGGEATWLQPLPDSLLGAGDPATAAIDWGSLRLAFVAALQLLSPRERAVLILRDVLDYPAAGAADILETSVASVNSSLQRARARIRAAGMPEEQVTEPSDAEQRSWVDRYMAAFVRADIPGLLHIVTEDVLMEMPPMVNWFTGRENYAAFMGWVFDKAGTAWRLLPVRANGQAGFAAYRRGDGGVFELHTLQVFTVTGGGISRVSVFQDPDVFAAFPLAQKLDG